MEINPTIFCTLGVGIVGGLIFITAFLVFCASRYSAKISLWEEYPGEAPKWWRGEGD